MNSCPGVTHRSERNGRGRSAVGWGRQALSIVTLTEREELELIMGPGNDPKIAEWGQLEYASDGSPLLISKGSFADLSASVKEQDSKLVSSQRVCQWERIEFYPGGSPLLVDDLELILEEDGKWTLTWKAQSRSRHRRREYTFRFRLRKWDDINSTFMYVAGEYCDGRVPKESQRWYLADDDPQDYNESGRCDDIKDNWPEINAWVESEGKQIRKYKANCLTTAWSY